MRDYKRIALLTLTAGSILLTSTGQAADLTAESSNPQILFKDTVNGAATDWTMQANEFSWLMFDDVNGVVTFRISNDADTEDTFIVDSSGDINLAAESVFIDRSTKNVGIGTITPENALHIKETVDAEGINTGIIFETLVTGGAAQKWELGNEIFGDTHLFILRDVTSDTEPFAVQANLPSGSLIVTENGIGVGTDDPDAKLDVQGDINATFDGTNSDSLQQLFVISANNANSASRSDAGFVLENARENFSWAFRTLEDVGGVEGTTGFAISKQGTGGRELLLVNNTDNDVTKVGLFLGNGAKNDTGSWDTASSRSYKKNIHDLSTEDAMQTLRGLKSVQYQYKSTNAKKIGFIAEDVPELVSNKDRKSLDPMQIVAVLTKAVQEQDKSLLETKATIKVKDQRIADMEARAEKNTSRLERLEAQLKKLLMK